MNELSLEELQKLIEEAEKQDNKKVTKDQRKRKEVVRFIRQNKIASGNVKVPSYLIYHRYILWCIEKRAKKWSKIEFFRTFKQFFEQKRTGKQRYYMLNDVFPRDKNSLERARKYNNKWSNSN